MSFSIKIEKSALKELKKITIKDQKRLIALIESLQEDPYKGKQMVGSYKGLFRVRSGNYRVIYSVINSELVILVLTIGHRRDVYR